MGWPDLDRARSTSSPGHSRDSAYGVGGLIAAASTIFFAYIGFEAVSTARRRIEEPGPRHADRHPRLAGRSAPILYILTCAVLVGIVPVHRARNDDPAPIAAIGGRPAMGGSRLVRVRREGRARSPACRR